MLSIPCERDTIKNVVPRFDLMFIIVCSLASNFRKMKIKSEEGEKESRRQTMFRMNKDGKEKGKVFFNTFEFACDSLQ